MRWPPSSTFDAVAPHYAQWDDDHMMSRELWSAAGEQGLLGLAVPEEFGGMGMSDYASG